MLHRFKGITVSIDFIGKRFIFNDHGSEIVGELVNSGPWKSIVRIYWDYEIDDEIVSCIQAHFPRLRFCHFARYHLQ